MSGSSTPPHSLVSGEIVAALVRLAKSTPSGAFVEVGVYKGGSAWHLARAAEEQLRPCYLYDTFTGIPHKGPIDSHSIGDFKDTSAEAVRQAIPYAKVVEGIFPESAVSMGPVAFVHLDCDQQQSYAQALEHFRTRMVKGGIIWCDDAPCLQGARTAVSEFAAAAGLSVVTPEDHGKSILFF